MVDGSPAAAWLAKPATKPAPSLNDWIAEVASRPRKRRSCITCENAEISAAVRQFAAKRQAEETNITWAQFHREFLAANGLHIHYLTMMSHVRECLGVRTVT